MIWPQLARWEAAFSASQILVLSLDQLIREPALLRQRLYGHFGLRSCSGGQIPKSNAANERHGCTAGRFTSRVDCERAGGEWTTQLPVTSIDCATKTRLARVFAPWNDRLFAARPDLGMPWKLSTPANGLLANGDHVPCDQGLAGGQWSNQSEPHAVAWANRLFEIHQRRSVECSIFSPSAAALAGLEGP